MMTVLADNPFSSFRHVNFTFTSRAFPVGKGIFQHFWLKGNFASPIMFEVEAAWTPIFFLIFVEFEDTLVLKIFDFGGVGQKPVNFAGKMHDFSALLLRANDHFHPVHPADSVGI